MFGVVTLWATLGFMLRPLTNPFLQAYGDGNFVQGKEGLGG